MNSGVRKLSEAVFRLRKRSFRTLQKIFSACNPCHIFILNIYNNEFSRLHILPLLSPIKFSIFLLHLPASGCKKIQ